MIRIDLGKSSFGKSGKQKPPGFFTLELPPALRAQIERLQIKGITVIIVGAAAAIAILFPLFASQYEQALQKEHQDQIRALGQKMSELASQIESYTPFKRELQSYEEQKKLVTDRLAVVRKLLDQRSAPVNTLDAVGQCLPARAWLTSLEIVLDPSPGVKMTGQAYSNEEISDFLDSLTRSVYLANVTLEDVTSKTDDKLELKVFAVSGQPKGKLDVALPQQPIAASQSPTIAAASPSANPVGGGAAPPAQAAPPNRAIANQSVGK